MRVNFMTPVQQVMASASHGATALYANKRYEENREENRQYRQQRMGLENRKLDQREEYLGAYNKQVENQGTKARALEKQAETEAYKAETERNVEYAEHDLTKSGNPRRKPSNAQEGIAQAFQTGSQNRNAYENSLGVHKEYKRFASGEVDLSSLKEG